MAACGTATFTDPYDYGATVPGQSINLVLTGGGDFKARLTGVDLRHLRLIRAEENLPHIAFITLAPEPIFVAFPIRHNPSVIWSGIVMQPGEIVLHSRAERMHRRASGTTCWGSISMAPTYLAKYGRSLARVSLEPPKTAKILRPSSVAAADLLRLHSQACRLARTKPDLIAHLEIARALEQGLIHALVNCLLGDETHEHSGVSRHAEIMVRFEDVLASFGNTQPSIAELCAAMDLPERTLRVCCSEVLGMSPTQYERLRRLNLARVALQRADPAIAGVTEIASQHGFTELGRFAATYRKAFGEAPSVTLRRGRINVCDTVITEFA